MAGPGRTGPPTSDVSAQVDYNTARHLVLLLHCRGLSHVAVAKKTGYCERQVRRIVKSAFGHELATVAVSDRAGRLLLRELEDYYLHTIEPRLKQMKEGEKFDKAVFDASLKTIDKMARLAGLY